MAAFQSRFNRPSASLAAPGRRCSLPCSYQPGHGSARRNPLLPIWHGAPGCRPVGSAKQYIARGGKADETLPSGNWQDERLYKVPICDVPPADKVAQAQKAAEAAHQAWMTTGPISEAMQTNSFLDSVMKQYSILQKLYHKAVLPVLEQHGHLAASGFTLAYAIYCQLLQKTADKVPGDTISSVELDLMAADVQQLPASTTDHKLADFASELRQLPDGFGLQLVPLFRLQDIISLLAEGPFVFQDAVGDVAEYFGIKGAFKGLASFAAARVFEGSLQRRALRVQQNLLAMCQPSSSLPDVAVADEVSVLALGVSVSAMASVEPVICSALRLLPSSDHAAVLHLELQLNKWMEVAHGSPLCTNSHVMPAGVIPGNIITLCLFTQYSAAMCASAFQQMSGETPLHDWSRAKAALTTETSHASLDSWLGVQRQLLSLAMDETVPRDEILERMQSTAEATTAGNLLQSASELVRIELARVAQYGCDTTAYTLEARGAQYMFLEMLFPGLLQVIDRNHGCWSSAMYWIDIVQLALQEAGGKSGPAAVAAGDRLVREKHSLFLARQALRLMNMQNPVFAAQYYKGASLLAHTPLSVDRDVNMMILARGSRKRAAEISAYLQAGSPLKDQGIGVAAGGHVSALQTRVDDDDSLQQEVVAVLRGRKSAQRIINVLAAAGTSSNHGSSEPGLTDAYAAWMTVRALSVVSNSSLTVVADHLWLPAALAQWWIHEHSSSQAVAKQLLGSGALEECYLRPIEEYVSSRAAAATPAVTDICRLGWSISSNSAVPMLKSQLVQSAHPTPQRVRSIVWLAAAALSAETVQQDSSYAAVVLEVACRAVGTDNVAMPLRLCLMLLYAVRYLERKELEMRIKGALWVGLLVTAAGPFAQMEPAVQALVQAAMKRIVRNSKHDKLIGFNLGMLKAVPLMHAEDYELLMQTATDAGDNGALLQIWTAAVAAASNLQLCQTPAFGGRRPNEVWLAQMLPRVLQRETGSGPRQMRKTTAASGSSSTISATQLEDHRGFVEATADAATRLLSELVMDDSSCSGQPAGWLLLDAVCSVLAAVDVARPDTLMLAVLHLLQTSPQLSKPTALVKALSAAARAGCMSGDDCLYRQVVHHAVDLQLTADDVSMVRSAALGAAAEAVQVGHDHPRCRQLLLQLWSDTLAAGKMCPVAASPVVLALGSKGELASQLLQSQLPIKIISTLLKAANSAKDQHVVSQMLQHAQQHDLLQQLPPDMLTVAVRCSGSASYQLLAAMLQQGAAPDNATTEHLLTAAAGTGQDWTELLTWLQQQCSTAPADAAHLFLLNLLTCSSSGASSADQSWQLYQLLQHCQQKGSWSVEQQQIPAGLCSSLTQQQISRPDRVVQLWRSVKVLSAAELTQGAQQVLIPAVAGLGSHAEAVQLVQQVPQQLSDLAKLWKQHNDGLTATHVLDALQLAIQQDSKEAAGALETLLEIVQQLQANVNNATAVSSVRLLCRHGHVSAAQQVLAEHVLGKAPAGTAASAVAAYVSAAASDSSQHQVVAQIFADMGTSEAQQYMSAAYNYLLRDQRRDPAPAAVGLLLHVMQSSMANQQLPALLDTQQMEVLCLYVCMQQHDSLDVTGDSQQTGAAAALPTPYDLGHQCLAGGVLLSPRVTAQLVNCLASNNADLQPAAAAVVLGIVDQANLAALDPDSRHKTTVSALGHTTDDGNHKPALEQTSKLIAELCYQQLAANTSGSFDPDEDSSGIADCVSQLSQQAAAAALFAAWHWQSGPTGSAGVCEQALGLLCLELYTAARSGGKPSLDSLLLDIGLAAAAAARQWDKGLNIIHTAERALSATVVPGSKRSAECAWLPLLPAALSALPAVLVHTEGVEKTAHRLLQEYEQQLGAGQQQLAATAAGRKGKGRPASSAAPTTSSTAGLLTLPCVNSFMQSAVYVALSSAAAGDDDAADQAAAAALRVANTLFAKQLIHLQLAKATEAAGSSTSADVLSTGADAVAGTDFRPDAVIYSCMLQLCGLTGHYQQVADITMAAVRGQLGLESSSSGPLQEVLAGSAAAWLSAGAADVVLCLLDGAAAAGVTHINHPALLEQLMKAAAQAEDAEQVLGGCLVGGVEVAEMFMLCETVEEAMQEVSALQAAAGVSSVAAGIMLAPSQVHVARSTTLEKIRYKMQQVAPTARFCVKDSRHWGYTKEARLGSCNIQ